MQEYNFNAEKLGHLIDIDFKEIQGTEYHSAIKGPLTKFYASKNKTAIIAEQDGQKVQLSKEMIRELPRMAERWIEK